MSSTASLDRPLPGQPFTAFKHQNAPATLKVSHVPEGLLGIAQCSRCGARAEHLASVPATVDPDSDEFLDFMGPMVRWLSDWGPTHSHCSPGTLSERAPAVESFVQGAIDHARGLLAADQGLLPVIWLLLEDGSVMAIPVDGLPRDPADPSVRASAVARMQSRIRRHLTVEGHRAEAAVLLTEAWTSERMSNPSAALGERREAVALAVTTRSWGYGAIAPLIRTSGRPEDGPGTIGTFEWGPLCVSLLLEGLLAEELHDDR
jgi:hypothetical protein